MTPGGWILNAHGSRVGVVDGDRARINRDTRALPIRARFLWSRGTVSIGRTISRSGRTFTGGDFMDVIGLSHRVVVRGRRSRVRMIRKGMKVPLNLIVLFGSGCARGPSQKAPDSIANIQIRESAGDHRIRNPLARGRRSIAQRESRGGDPGQIGGRGEIQMMGDDAADRDHSLRGQSIGSR